MKIFIPIKQNSQRVPRKNFRLLNGEQLFKYVMLKYNDFEIFVDTDSDEVIHEVNNDQRLHHVTAYRRRRDQVGDKISVCGLLHNFLEKFKIQEPVIQTHVTSPFLTPQMLKDAYSYIGELLEKGGIWILPLEPQPSSPRADSRLTRII